MSSGGPQAAELLVVTDLDGCLLDAQTYSWEPAREALLGLRRRGIPLVPCTTKTRAELEALAPELGLDGPWIIEGGAALVVPRASGNARPGDGRLPGAMPRTELVRALCEIAAETGVRLRGFSEMTLAEIEALTGLSPQAAVRAARREFDEPFRIEARDAAAAVRRAALRRGLRVNRGGRFFHLTGAVDKGEAVRELRRLYASDPGPRCLVVLGDAPADLSMLRAADRPILVPGRAGIDPKLARALPSAERAPEPGPAGWNRALLALLAGQRLPGVAAAARKRA